MGRKMRQNKKLSAVNYVHIDDDKPLNPRVPGLYKLMIDRQQDYGGGSYRQFFVFSSVEKAKAYAQGYADEQMSHEEWIRDGSIQLKWTDTTQYILEEHRCILKDKFHFEIRGLVIDHAPPQRLDIQTSDYPKLGDTWSQFFDED